MKTRAKNTLCLALAVAVIAIIVACSGTTTEPVAKNLPAAGEVFVVEEPPIAGLTPADVTERLSGEGFTGEDPKTVGGSPYWRFELDQRPVELSVEVYGADESQVRRVQALALNTGAGEGETDRLSREFLGFVAATPYENADPAAAKRWVQKNLGRNARTVIGGVAFELFANVPRARLLSLTATKDEASADEQEGEASADGQAEQKADDAAAAKLRLAMLLDEKGKKGTRDRYLRELVKEFPESAAADEARAFAAEHAIELREPE